MDYQQKLTAAAKHLAHHDAKLRKIIENHGPCKIQPHSDYYGELISSVVGQQLSTKAAATIWGRVLALFDGQMPSPDQLLAIPDEKLRAAGLSWAKVSYVKDLARHIIDQRLDLNHIATMPNDQLIKQLTAVKGIGEWSAHMFMIFGLGRLNILPTGDLGIKKAIKNTYKLSALPEPAQCITIAAKNNWQPYESVAAWYLWQSLDKHKDKKSSRRDGLA